jgi:hypothetical protein
MKKQLRYWDSIFLYIVGKFVKGIRMYRKPKRQKGSRKLKLNKAEETKLFIINIIFL